MGIIYFAVMIGVLVFIHELGHFLAARLFGVGVTEFSVGFGPRITGFQRGGTDFVICALPLGGYVAMAQTPEEAGEEKALHAAGLWPRAAIAFAGPLFSLLFAVPCYLLVGLGMSTTPAPIVAHMSAEDSPAAVAGLQVGDEITAINGAPIHYWHELRGAIAQGGDAIEVTVQREGATQVFKVKPKHVGGHGPVIGVSHVPRDADGQPLAEQITTRDFPLAERIPHALTTSVMEPLLVSKRVISSLTGMVTGAVSTKQLGGPIMIFNVASDAGRAGWQRFLVLMAVITINLGLINLLPIPVLDGGRLVLILIEAIQRRPLSLRTQQISAMVGMAMVLALMVLAFKNDIERYWQDFASWLGA